MVGFQKQISLREAMDGRQKVLDEATQALENDDGTLDPEMREFYERLLESEKEVTVRLDPVNSVQGSAEIRRKRRLVDEVIRELQEDDGRLDDVQRESYRRILRAAGEEIAE